MVLLVHYVATAGGAFYAFTDWTGLGDFNFIGLDNFRRIFEDPALLGSLKNTLLLAFGFLVLTNVFGLLLALALNRTLKTRYLLRVLIFMPVVLSPLAVSYIWKFIFDFNGPLNQFLGWVGLESWQRPWLADPNLAIWAILTVMVWQTTGLVVVIYLAGLATVPIEIEEASALDGAGTWGRFWHITVPSIRPSIAIAGTLMLIQGLRVFDQVMALTNGGPGGATETLATQVYKETFALSNFGFGAALALTLTVIILFFSVLQQLATRDRT
jgi:raffinose/stachyose/melibiose transport system permease protein